MLSWWLGRLDHSMIFVLIAGSFTPFTLLDLMGPESRNLFLTSWGLALGGSILMLAWYDMPKWLTAIVYISVGWVAVFDFVIQFFVSR